MTIHRALAALAALSLLAACAAKPPAAVAPAVAQETARTVSTGALVGAISGEAYAWKAIPFAAPPVGPLRWRAPRPPLAWAGVREAVNPAPWCPQVLSALDGVPEARYGEIAGQEDCLTLDIYAPRLAADAAKTANLPVMVWIHGGSNVWGRAQQYDGSALAARFNVVVVVVQYRLGPFGWMAHEALRAGGETPEDASANFGTLDHIRALEWVRDEIAVFGGDPSRVTVFGESAGGHNVAALLASPRAKGLFHRAIVQSGSFRSTPLAEAEGLEGDRADSARAVAAKLAPNPGGDFGAALRAVPMEKVFSAYDTSRRNFDPPRVIADGVVLPAEGLLAPLDRPEAYNAVPIITGTNRDEMKLFNALDPRLTKRTLGRFIEAREPVFYEAASSYPSRMWRAAAVDAPASRMVGSGRSDVFAYRFDWDEQSKVFVTDLGKLLGAAHSLEIPFVFGRFQLLGAFDKYAFTEANAPGRIALSDAMMSYWVNFAATGTPGRGVKGDLPEWGAWSNAESAPRLIVFDTPAGGGVRMIAGAETPEGIARDLFADPTLTPAQRCTVFLATQRWNPELTGADSGAC